MKQWLIQWTLMVPLICGTTMFFLDGVTAQELPHLDTTGGVGFMNLKTKTLGGLQYWTDVRNVGGWRIQRNSNTGHFRLIDPANVRHAWGDRMACEHALNQQIIAGTAQPYTGKVVILLHGLMRTSRSLKTLARRLEQEGYTPILFQYASSRETIDVMAHDLKQVIDGLGPQVTEINFVGHSLGNIVVRHYLGDLNRAGVAPDPRFHRMVMLAPPNQGSRMADLLKNRILFRAIAGKAGLQLGAGWAKLEPQLATPTFEFGIIAGGQAKKSDWNNFMLSGQDDFTVSLDETRLAGATDTLVRPFMHGTIMNQPLVLEAVPRFLKHRFFVSEAERHPIPADWKPTPPLFQRASP